MRRKAKKQTGSDGTKVRLRPETREKFQRIKDGIGLPFSEIADKAVDALLREGISFPGQEQTNDKRGPALCQA